MAVSESIEVSCAKEFLIGRPDRLKLALAVEVAVESLRKDAETNVDSQLSTKILHVSEHAPDGWRVTAECKGYRPRYWRRLYKDRGGWDETQFSGVWVGRWPSERLALEVCVEGWPAGESSIDREVRTTFRKFVTDESNGLWREEPKKGDAPRRISWRFDGSRAFLIGEVEKEVARIADLIEALVKTIDQAESKPESTT